tara:strand:+ start:993 stop:1349 length:357 start_codon:yes stop_codon:yes gene_type:complete
MKPRSAKAKGKRLQNKVTQLLQEKYSSILEAGDFKSTTMGEHGMDVQLSPSARKVFPFAIECKNQEQLNIWKSLEQAESNCEGLTPLLVFKRNKTKIYAALEISDFLNLLDGNKKETN